MTVSFRSIAERHSRQVSSIFAAMSGMAALGLVGQFPGAGVVTSDEYPLVALILTSTILAGFLTVKLDNNRSLLWTAAEMSAFFVMGFLAPLLLNIFN